MISKKVLVMEDDSRDWQVAANLLQQFGYDALCAPTVPAAMRLLEEQRFAGILVDNWVEEGSGERILNWVHERQREEPVIIMSALADYDQMIDFINKGAVDMIAKPIQPAQLRCALEMALVTH